MPHFTIIGRRIYAIGNNATAARFTGINTKRYRLWIFTVTGLMCGLASILLTSRIGSTRPNIAMGWELEIITLVILGGVNILGGSGKIFGVLISVFVIGMVMFGFSRYLDCGDLHCGFARIKCESCGHEYILGFSCRPNYTSFC